MENIIIPNPRELEKTKQLILSQGKENIQVISDFDRTLTNAFVDGKKVPSVISILREGPYLTKDYRERAIALFKKYSPIEINPEIPLEEKKRAMHEWWTAHFDLLIKSGLNKKDLEKIIEDKTFKFREGALEFIDILHENEIPLVIISSSGVGDAILMRLEKERRLYKNVYVVTNLYIWDKSGNAIGVKKPIIHSMNKDEISIKEHPFYSKIRNRKNIILLGNILEDVEMVKGFSYSNIIKVGFLNDRVEENLSLYKKNFDIVLLNDTSMHYVNELLKEITLHK